MKVSKKKFAVKENINIKNKPAESKRITMEFNTASKSEEIDSWNDNTHHPHEHPQDQRAQAD